MSPDQASYFRSEPTWEAVFTAIRERLAQLGRVGGTLPVDEPGAIHAIEAVGCPVRRGRVDLARLDAELRAGRFPDGLWVTVEAYFGEPIVPRAALRAEAAAAWTDVFARWHDALATEAGTNAVPEEEHQRLVAWLDASATALRRHWHADAEAADAALRVALRAAAGAPGDRGVPSALPVFALEQTGDPHGFDADQPASRYLLPALAARFLGDASRARGDALERDLVLEAAGLSSDGISSVVACSGLVGGSLAVDAARLTGEVLALPVITVQRLGVVRGADGTAFVVENPAVFVSLWRRLKDHPPAMRPTLICSSGQLSLAALILLDQLVEHGTRIRYSGDFDGMGLRIAGRLLRRYGDRCVLWRMTADDYTQARAKRKLGQDAAVLDVAKLDEIPLAVRTAVAANGAAYQEALIDALADDLLDTPHLVSPCGDRPATAPGSLEPS